MLCNLDHAVNLEMSIRSLRRMACSEDVILKRLGLGLGLMG